MELLHDPEFWVLVAAKLPHWALMTIGVGIYAFMTIGANAGTGGLSKGGTLVQGNTPSPSATSLVAGTNSTTLSWTQATVNRPLLTGVTVHTKRAVWPGARRPSAHVLE